MAHTRLKHYFHLAWSTKNRSRYISPDIQLRLYDYLGAIVRNYKAKLLAIGGMPDHVHLLVEFP
jgi:REP element-mobilizing transposase RayT